MITPCELVAYRYFQFGSISHFENGDVESGRLEDGKGIPTKEGGKSLFSHKLCRKRERNYIQHSYIVHVQVPY